MKKIEQEIAEKRKKRYVFLSTCIVATTVLLALFQLILSNQLASQGKYLSVLLKEEKSLLSENAHLSREIAKFSSISEVSQKAQNLSFVPAAKFLVVEGKASVALAK